MNENDLPFLSIMIRRLKNDILKQLPAKKRFLMRVQIEDEGKKKAFISMLAELSQYEELMAKKKERKEGDKREKANSFINTEQISANDDVDGILKTKVEKKRIL
jgi:hypothetical protein